MDRQVSSSLAAVRAAEAPIRALVAGGDLPSARDALARAYVDRVHAYCQHAAADPSLANRMTQHLFSEAFRDLGLPPSHVTLRGWLIGMARGACHAAPVADAPGGTQDSQAAVVAPPARAPDRGEEHRETGIPFRAVMQQLDEKTREAVEMRYLHDLSYEEMCDVLGGDVGSLQRRVARGLHQLLRGIEANEVTP